MGNDKIKEEAIKNAYQGETVTDEFDRFRGYWVRSDEGDIIRASGERGYWSSEPPSLEFREERREKLRKVTNPGLKPKGL